MLRPSFWLQLLLSVFITMVCIYFIKTTANKFDIPFVKTVANGV